MTELLATKTSLVGQVEGVYVGGSSLHTWLMIAVGEDKQNILGLVVRSPGGGGAP